MFKNASLFYGRFSGVWGQFFFVFRCQNQCNRFSGKTGFPNTHYSGPVEHWTPLTQLSLTYLQYSFYCISFDFAPLITTLSHFKDRSKVPRCLPSAQIRQRFQSVPSFPINSLNQLTRRRPAWRGARREMAAIQSFRSRVLRRRLATSISS